MLNQDTKQKIKNTRDILVGKVPDPKAQVEQITFALIYKFMDDMDKQSQELPGGKAQFFTNGYEKYAWSKILDPKLGGHERLELYAEAITRMSENKHIPQLFRDVFKDAFLPYRSPETLSLFLKEINGFSYDHSEDLGDSFEYLLSVLGSQGDAGQFRTPRHIIDFIVEVVSPKKDEAILDPACGTAGFLISAYKHILKEHKNKPLSPDEKSKLMKNLVGYDISPDMVRLSKVNMYLHGFAEPKIYEYDTLSSEEKWDETYDVIMANPPFMTPKGGIRPHKRFSVQANRAEVLFVDYIKEHLRLNGRAGIIVPEGIIFQSAGAYKQIRKLLVEDGLFAVVSLPAGVFNPYSGVKTSILFFDNSLAKKTDKILFIRVLNDGFDLGAQRKTIDRNDLVRPDNELDAVKVLKGQRIAIETGTKNTWLQENSIFAYEITKEQIARTGDYSLSAETYRLDNLGDQKSHKYPIVNFQDVCTVDWGNTNLTKSSYVENGKYLAVSAAGCDGRIDNYEHEVGVTVLSAIGANCGRVFYPTENFTAIKNTITFTPDKNKIIPKYLFYIMQTNELPRRGGGQPFMSKGDVQKYKIPLPPLDVQKQIVKEIEGKQAIIENAKELIQKVERERANSGQIFERLKCEKYPLGDLVDVLDNMRKPVTKSDRKSGKYPYYGATGILDYVDKFIFSERLVLVGEDGAKWLAGDKTAFIADGEYWVNNHAHVVRPKKDKLIDDYLVAYLNAIDLSPYITGVTVPKLNQEKLRSIPIPLPDLDTQKDLADKFNKQQSAIDANLELIEVFEGQVKEKMTEVWGE